MADTQQQPQPAVPSPTFPEGSIREAQSAFLGLEESLSKKPEELELLLLFLILREISISNALTSMSCFSTQSRVL